MRISLADHQQRAVTSLWTAFMFSVSASLVYVKNTMDFFSGEAVFWIFLLHVMLCMLTNGTAVSPDLASIKWFKKSSGGHREGRTFLNYNGTLITMFGLSGMGWFFDSAPYLFMRMLFLVTLTILAVRFTAFNLAPTSKILHNLWAPFGVTAVLGYLLNRLFATSDTYLFLQIGYLSTIIILYAWISHLKEENPRRISFRFVRTALLLVVAVLYFNFFVSVSHYMKAVQDIQYFQYDHEMSQPYQEGGPSDDPAIFF